MTVLKEKMSISISSDLVKLLEATAKATQKSKSELVESALSQWADQRMAEDAKQFSKLKFDDLPSENEWIKIQPKW